MPRRPRFNALAAVALLLCASVFTSLAAHAQKPAETVKSTGLASMVAAPPSISGRTLEKKSFTLASLKGKVVLVMFWSTDCAICLDKMPELRENVQGWTDKPFEMVLVSVDRRMADVDGYNAIVNKSIPLKQRFTQLWTGDATYQDNLDTANLTRAQLPATLLIDKQGKLVERFNGRISADVWDKISDLL
jgi:cytochrome oxidase Cu insertion factor (SCO1/SenC/PrrC family)